MGHEENSAVSSSEPGVGRDCCSEYQKFINIVNHNGTSFPGFIP